MVLRHLVLASIGAAALATPRAGAQARNTGGTLPSVSPDGRYVAFNATRDGKQADTYVVRPDGSGVVRITNTPETEGAPAWLGGRVLVWRRLGDSARIETADPTGGRPRLLGVIDGREFRPSPDGKCLLFARGSWTAAVLRIATPDGSAPRDVTDGAVTAFNPAWSPDGRQIAFTTMGPDHRTEVAIVNVDGTAMRTAARLDPADGSPQWPAWSPDGTRLAVQVGKYDRDKPAENTAHIWIVDLATGRATTLAEHAGPYLDETPSWFPDGKRIAFQSDRTGRMEIWVMNVDGTGARQLTRVDAGTR